MAKLSKIFIFDLDGNLFNTPTSFYFEEKQKDGSWKEIEIAAYKYDANPGIYHNAEYYRYLENDAEKSYQNFRDFANHPRHRGPDGLILDIKTAIKDKHHAPSLKMFKEALIEGQFFAILTARGHTPDNLKRMVMLINDELLTSDEKTKQIINIKNNFELDTINNEINNKTNNLEILEKYFNYNGYLPVNNIEWCKASDIEWELSSELKKTLAMDKFLKYIQKFLDKRKKKNLFKMLSCGFSDDSTANIKSMITYFLKISHEKKYLNNYSIYFTGHEDKDNEIIDHLNKEVENYIGSNSIETIRDTKNSILKIDMKL